jgi:hypothetical protein
MAKEVTFCCLIDRRCDMRKLIMMAIAGFVWRKIQARGVKSAPAGGSLRRY